MYVPLRHIVVHTYVSDRREWCDVKSLLGPGKDIKGIVEDETVAHVYGRG